MTYTDIQNTGTQNNATQNAGVDLTERESEALRAAGLTASRQLPASGSVVVGEPLLVTDLGGVLVGTDGQALTVDVTGAATGTVTLVVARHVAAALQDGPLGAADITAALMTPVTDAVAELEVMIGGSLHVGVADAVEAHALDFRPDAQAVPLDESGTRVAVLVVDLSVEHGVDAPEGHVSDDGAEFTPLVENGAGTQAQRSMELLHDVEMAVTVELGRTRMAVSDLLSLAPGAVVELDRAAGSPVDVLVNGKLIARGEVVVIDDDFGIRISEIVGLQQSPG